jgi:hypothetical protein
MYGPPFLLDETRQRSPPCLPSFPLDFAKHNVINSETYQPTYYNSEDGVNI